MKHRWVVPTAVLAATLPLLVAFHRSRPILYDTDAYYHLAVARSFAASGVPETIPQLRFSTLSDGFGDKELLFHLFLAPFASGADPVAGGSVALAVLEALILALVAALAVRAIGAWGGLVALWLPFASTELAWRLVRLRPELLSLLLLLVALWAAGRGRDRWLAPLGALYALSYTAFHAYLGLFAALFVVRGWRRRRWSWALLVYPALGVAAGLALHPNFPANLRLWAIQNVLFFLGKGSLEVGTEIRPNFADVTLVVQLGWLAGLAVLWRSAVPTAEGDDEDLADAFATAAFAFSGLYLFMSRFSLYAFVFVTLAVLFELRRRGLAPGGWIALPGRGSIPTWVGVGLCLLISYPEAKRQLDRFHHRTAAGPESFRLEDRRAVGAAIPPGGKVVAPRGETAIYMLWAPQGRYLNVLDPHFMAVPYPLEHRALTAIRHGQEPDVPLAAATTLDSDYLAYSTALGSSRMTARLRSDPRVEELYRGLHAAYRFRADANAGFVLDWRVLPPGAGLENAASGGAPYPRAHTDRGRSFEGYVDARRLGGLEGCRLFVHHREIGAPTRVRFELAPYGPTTLWLDGTPVARVRGAWAAILGRGLTVPLELSPGRRQITVESCPVGDQQGFYLLERSRESRA